MTAAISGVMLVVAELMLIAAAAIAGKEGFAFIKATLFGFWRSYGPPREVSRFRYNVGLAMFVTPLAFGWVTPYVGRHLSGVERSQLIYAIIFDVLLVASLFVLGSGFWDNLRSLFEYNAYAVIPDDLASERDCSMR